MILIKLTIHFLQYLVHYIVTLMKQHQYLLIVLILYFRYLHVLLHKELGYQKSYFLEDFKEEAIDSDYIGWGLSDKFILNKVYNLIKEADRKTFIQKITINVLSIIFNNCKFSISSPIIKSV